MIIGIDASRANREEKTGVEWYAYYLIEELKKITKPSEHQFFLYTDKPLRGKLARLPNHWQEKILRWPLKYLWTKIRFSWEMLKNKPDLLFIPSHVIPLFYPKKIVITIHDLGYERYPEAYSSFSRFYLRKNYKFAVRHATKIIVPTEFTKKELIGFYQTEPAKIEVIHLGYRDKIFQPIQNQEKINKVLEKYKIKRPYLLFVGRLETKKGLRTLLEAYSKFYILNPEFSLVLVGRPGYGYDKNLKSQISNLKFVRELGYLSSEEERACLYAGAEIFIFPSLYEGFGLPILEAMASGCPVVASAIESTKEIAGDGAIFFQNGDSQDLTEKIQEVFKNQELRQRMIAAGLKRVKNFSWRKCAEETFKVLISVLE